jgi:hypothetical protein
MPQAMTVVEVLAQMRYVKHFSTISHAPVKQKENKHFKLLTLFSPKNVIITNIVVYSLSNEFKVNTMEKKTFARNLLQP